MSAIRILIVDDHPIVRDGIAGVLSIDDELQVVATASDGLECLAELETTEVDVVLMDLRMPRMGGVEAIRRIRERGTRPAVVVLTTFDSDDDVLPAIEAGADGYLLKDTSGVELRHAVREAYAGRPVIVSEVAAALMRRSRVPRPQLSPRETEVLRLVADGATNKEISRALFLGETTVKTHLNNVFEKLGVHDRAAAVHVGHQIGILSAKRPARD